MDSATTADLHDSTPVPSSVGPGRGIPLSIRQQALAFLEASHGQQDPSIIARAVRFRGPVVLRHLEAGFQRLVDRHPALRARRIGDGLRCDGAPPFSIDVHDGRDLVEAELRHRLRREARRPFELDRELPIRVAWWRLEIGGVLLMSLHHGCTDLWSLGALAAELGEWLQEDGSQEPANAGEDWSFAGLAEGRDEQSRRRQERGIEHFRSTLADGMPQPLPRDRRLPPRRRFQAYVRRLELGKPASRHGGSDSTTQALERLAQGASASTATALLGLYGAFLAHWTGDDEARIGLLVPGRSKGTPPRAVGYFMNTVPVRLVLDGSPSASDAVAVARHALLGALRYQSIAFPTLVERLNPSAGRGTAPLVQALFSFQAVPVETRVPGLTALVLEVPGEPVRFGPLAGEVVPVDLASSPYELALMAGIVDGRLHGRLELAEDSFAASTARRLRDRFTTFVSAAVHEPDRPLRELPRISQREHRELRMLGSPGAPARSGSSAVLGSAGSVHEAVRARAEAAPDALAVRATPVSTATGDMPYGELAARVSRRALGLQHRGVGREERVAVVLDRGPELVPTLLAVVATGAAFVPLAPDLPPARRERMLSIAGARRLLTDRPTGGEPLPAGVEILTPHVLDEAAGTVSPQARRSRGAGLPKADPEQLAYVQFTSGSTGKPKGVEVSHCALSNLLGHFVTSLDLGPSSRFLALAPLTFDVSLLELLAPLVSGGEVLLATDAERLDGRRLRSLLEAAPPTHLQATPVIWRSLLDAGWRDGAGCTALCGGEALAPELAERILATGAALRNVYGPTETTIWSTEAVVTASENGTVERVSLGKAIRSTRLGVLDDEGRPAPIGVAGELAVAGRGLARGYAGQPARTAERFVPAPVTEPEGGPEAGGRLYCTGDRVRWRCDGSLEFLGRVDRQIKLRGVRLEPGEIEAALRAHPSVADARVQAVAGADGGDPVLAAWVTVEPTPAAGAPTSADLREHLRTRLPRDRVPSRFKVLDRWPLNRSGKVDPARLPSAEATAHPEEAGAGGGGLPEDALTSGLAALWEELLGVPPAGHEADFFTAGGHSLTAGRLLARLSTEFGVEVPLGTLLENGSFGALRAAVAASGRDPDDAAFLQTLAEPGRLSPGQMSMWFAQQVDPRSTAFHMAAAFRIRGPFDRPALDAAFRCLTARHPMLRTAFEEVDGEPRMKPGRPPSPAHVDFAGGPNERALKGALDAMSGAPFDQGSPPWRAACLRLGPQHHVVSFCQHHLIGDGASIEILAVELSRAYRSFAAGTVPDLPPPAGTYAEFVERRRRALESPAGRRALAAEVERLGSVLPTEWTPDGPRPERRSWRGRRRRSELSEELSSAVRKLAGAGGATPFMVLLTAFAVVLRRRTGEAQVVLGTDVADRRRPEEAGVFGFFVDQRVLVCDLATARTFADALAAARRALAEACAAPVPFEAVDEALRRRDPGRPPLFRIKVVALEPTAVELGRELTVEELPVGPVPAKFDLTLFVSTRQSRIRLTFDTIEGVFEDATVARLADDVQRLLQHAVDDFEHPLRTSSVRSPLTMSPKFQRVAPRPVEARPASAVETRFLRPDLTSPLVIQPRLDVELAQWARFQDLDALLLEHGALLFRGFPVPSAAAFSEVARSLVGELYADNGELPRESLDADDIYTSTPYPEDRMISWHNENSFLHRWPGKIAFCCLIAAEEGGETPLCDSRTVLAKIPREIRERFEAHGIEYLRNFGRGLGLGWQTAFRTNDPKTVEDHCERHGITFEWRSDDHLRLRWKRPAIALHHATGEALWFNQATHFHPAMLGAEAVAAFEESFDPDDLPRSCFYGDGSPIADDEIEAICDAYRSCQIVFPWQEGDVVLLDNMLMAHARNPYRGERRLAVAVGEILDDSALPA